MRIFISWSGPLGQKIGEELRNWMPSVLQAVNPYFSPEDIGKGTRWADEISGELDKCEFGIVILDKAALNSSWVSFESGALSKKIGKSKLTPILIEIEPTDVTGPLVQFQACSLEKSDISKLLCEINSELGDKQLGAEVFNRVFEKWYPEFESNIKTIIKEHKKDDSSGSEVRPDRELLEEILSLTRNKSRQQSVSVPSGAIRDLIESIEYIDTLNLLYGPDPHIYKAAKFIARPAKYLLKHNSVDLIRGKSSADYVEQIDSILGRIESIQNDIPDDD